MSVKTKIIDPSTEVAAVVSSEGTLQVVNHGHAPVSETIFALPFRQYFTDDGMVTGSEDMTVNGLTTAQEFWVEANSNRDTYIVTISVDLGDGGSPNMNKFGDLLALSNGIECCYITQDEGNIVIHDGIKTNREFVRFGNETPAFGTGADAFLADASGGGSEKAYLPKIDTVEQFGLPFGIKLRKGTKDRLIFSVRDDLTALTTFNIIAYGNRLVENGAR
jgi:hypothetical protein